MAEQTSAQNSASRRPSHTLYALESRGENVMPYFHTIGAAWTNQNGSLSLKMNYVPLDGSMRLQLRPYEPRDTAHS